MKKIVLLIFVGVVIIAAVILLGSYYYLQGNHRYPAGTQHITSKELGCGGYYGSDKKIGTPNDWVHDAIGSKSESWHRPLNWDGWLSCLYKK